MEFIVLVTGFLNTVGDWPRSLSTPKSTERSWIQQLMNLLLCHYKGIILMFKFPFLGKPVCQVGHTNSKIGSNWSLPELNKFVRLSYPNISLNLVRLEFARTSKGRKIQKLQFSSVRGLKAAVGKSWHYIMPLGTVMEVRIYIYRYYISYCNHVDLFSVMSMPIPKVTLLTLR